MLLLLLRVAVNLLRRLLLDDWVIGRILLVDEGSLRVKGDEKEKAVEHDCT